MEITPGIHQLRGLGNCFLMEVNDNLILIDTGIAGNTNKILDYLKNHLKRGLHDIKTIVITHHHFDHVGSLDKIKKITGAKVAAHHDDADYISGKKNQEGPALLNIMVRLLKLIYRIKPVEVDILLDDRDHIDDYLVIHTPGHTPGSICLYNPKNKVIFVGDNLRYVKGKIESPSPKLIMDQEQYKRSMEKLADLDIKVIFTGHSAPVTSDASEKLEEFLKNLP